MMAMRMSLSNRVKCGKTVKMKKDIKIYVSIGIGQSLNTVTAVCYSLYNLTVKLKEDLRI